MPGIRAQECDENNNNTDNAPEADLFAKTGKGNICFLPRHYNDYSKIIENFQVRDDDVWVVSYIKAGTTWTQEMAWLIGNDLNYSGAQEILPSRFPYFEFDTTWSNRGQKSRNNENRAPTSMDAVHHMSHESPRYIKSHLPFHLLPAEIRKEVKSPKIIYCARNPKDVCVSFYHHRVLTEDYAGTIDDFVEEFIGTVANSKYAPYWTHVQEFWQRRHQSNILFITYEEMKANLRSVVTKCAKFLKKTISEDEMQRLLNHLSFESMKLNPYVNYDDITEALTRARGQERKTHFMRKGKVGSWKEELSPESITKFNTWIKENQIEGIWE